MNISAISKAIQIVREAMRLSAAVQSRHSRAQWGGNIVVLFVASGIVAAITAFQPALIPSLDVAVSLVLSITVVISPVVSRAIALTSFAEETQKVGDDVKLVRLRRHGETVWQSTSLNVGQARLTAYTYGVDKEGNVIDLATRKIVDHIRISKREREGNAVEN